MSWLFSATLRGVGGVQPSGARISARFSARFGWCNTRNTLSNVF
jgi:hypothetical protein